MRTPINTIPYNFNPISANLEKIEIPFFRNVNKTPLRNNTIAPLIRKLIKVFHLFSIIYFQTKPPVSIWYKLISDTINLRPHLLSPVSIESIQS